MGYSDYLRTGAVSTGPREVLRSAPTVLLGVGPGAGEVLGRLGIDTVFDLACSTTFAAAALVQRAATDTSSVEARTGTLPGDLLVGTVSVPLMETPSLGVDKLRLVADAGLGPGALGEALDVRTVRDLALWPPYVAARAILAEATDERPVGVDEVPTDLLPMSGRYPTERAFYSSFVLADLPEQGAGDRLPLEQAGQLDPLSALEGLGFTQPARGARLTFAQSWYSQGVALGQLLHSLALAPGESTRVAMIDWSRQQTGTQGEQSGQVEQIAGGTTHKRAMSEVQDAVAREAQNGFSDTSANSQQVQAGGGGGFSLGPFTGGASTGYGSASSSGSTVTGTSGVRSIAATMTQDVADATSQAASSVRTMFASVVRELSQSEHEAVSTRVVANYNHMHALTVQYYEVVQIFRMTVQLHALEPCLFVPMRPVDFLAAGKDGATPPGVLVLRRYRAALQAVARDAQTAALLDADASREVRIELRPTVQRDLDSHPAPPPAEVPADQGTTPPAVVPGAGGSSVDQPPPTTGLAGATRVDVPDGVTLQSVRATFPARSGGLLLMPQANDVMTYEDLRPNVGSDGMPFQADLRIPVPLADVSSLTLDTGQQQIGFVTLVLGYQGGTFEVNVPVVVFGAGQGEQVLTVRRVDPVQTLLSRLAEDPLRYSQAVWRAMDSATVSLLLARYTYAGQPLSTLVDPAPIGTSGNFLIFRMPAEARDLLEGAATGPLADDEAWMSWLRQHADYESVVEDFVPLPSGGVFAEAVLGRANSAEKLDITRFWNWQDSPIPLTAPDIQPVQTGSRARDDSTTPTGLAAPVVAFNNPTALPDPTGLSATLGALANGGMFRDMSGTDSTAALALAALTGAGSGATAAGDQGRAYAALATQKEIEMAKLAAGLVTGGVGGGGAGKAVGTVSEQGAKINEGRSLDERAVTAAPDGAGAASEHETRAVEGDSSKAVDLLTKLASSSSSSSSAAPASSSSSDASSSSPTTKSSPTTTSSPTAKSSPTPSSGASGSSGSSSAPPSGGKEARPATE